MNALHSIFRFFYEILFGCAHERLSRPFSLEDQCYMVCLECGAHVPYSPVTMRRLSGREIRRMKAVRAAALRVLPASAPAGPVLAARPESGPHAA